MGAQSSTLRLEATPQSTPQEGRSGTGAGEKQQTMEFEFQLGQGAEEEAEEEPVTPQIQIPQIQITEPEPSLPGTSTEKSKGKRPVTETEEEEEQPLINIRRVFSTVNRELLDIFPPSPGQFNIAPTDVLSKQQQQQSAQQESEWPIPETYHGGPTPLATHERVLAERPTISNIRPREALSKTQPRWPTQLFGEPFLEERIPQIFAEQLYEVDDIFLLNSTEHERAVRFAATFHASPKEKVASKFPIVKIDLVYLRNFLNYSMVHFHVTRADGKRYTFHEVELRHLNLADITFLEDQLACNPEKSREEQRGLVVIREFMRKKILLSRTHDLQLGAEADLEKINVLKPNRHHSKLNQLRKYTIIENYDDDYEGAEGIVVPSLSGAKSFMRLSELNAYSDGTLQRCISKFRRTCYNNRHTQEQDLLVQMTRVADQMEEKVQERKAIRSWERLLGQRGR